MAQSSLNFAVVMQLDDRVLEQGHGNLQVSTLMLLGPMRCCNLVCCRPVHDW